MTFRNFLYLAFGVCLALPLAAQNREQQPEGAAVSFHGTVVDSDPDSFLLDYGRGTITVQMEGWDWYRENYSVLPQDRVTVFGTINDDFFEATKLEASSVYVEDLNTYFYPRSGNQETSDAIAGSVYDFDLELTGDVVAVDARQHRFTLDTGDRELRVDTLGLPFNPLDDKGFVQLEKGDRVTVFSELSDQMFSGNVLQALALVNHSSDERSGG
ncbi:MAG: hypothetical protein ACFB21_10780 [Opitutales bacterium]